MILSKTCNYGIKAAIYVSLQEDRKYVPIREISGELNISFHFLTKILQILTKRNIMISFRGPRGGVSLARPAHSISLIEVIEAIDGPVIFHDCVLGLEHCGEDRPCPIHSRWEPIRESLKKLFQDASLASMTGGVREGNLRLTDQPSSREGMKL